jgi:hypothetical protein
MTRYGRTLKKRYVSIFGLRERVKELEFCCEVKDHTIDELEADVCAAAGELRSLRRLHNSNSRYDKNAVAGFAPDTAAKLAEIAETVVEGGGVVTFAAACAMRLKKELDHAKHCNRTLNEYIAEQSKRPKNPTPADDKVKYWVAADRRAW